mmetsp:Transcript_10961/g.24316  ORF Transcript_10961/g.24316 Transcript_10961/m.24316 type:complete len:219 (+) Transcript_10961:1009-1665(+)
MPCSSADSEVVVTWRMPAACLQNRAEASSVGCRMPPCTPPASSTSACMIFLKCVRSACACAWYTLCMATNRSVVAVRSGMLPGRGSREESGVPSPRVACLSATKRESVLTRMSKSELAAVTPLSPAPASSSCRGSLSSLSAYALYDSLTASWKFVSLLKSLLMPLMRPLKDSFSAKEEGFFTCIARHLAAAACRMTGYGTWACSSESRVGISKAADSQ